MQEIARDIFIEESYPGVVLGALKLNGGVILVDAPYRNEDLLSWRSQINNLRDGSNQLLVMLDTHVDRTIGIHGLEVTVLAHHDAIEIMNLRLSSSRSQDIAPGLNWENKELPGNIRWVVPEMTYTGQVNICWDETPVVVSHQPGAHLAGSWLRDESEKIVFIGDSIITNQPPYIGWADLDIWMDELDWLRSDDFKDYTIVSSRQGEIGQESIETMQEMLTAIKMQVEDIARKKDRVDALKTSSAALLNKFKYDLFTKDRYIDRLIRGLEKYLLRHYSEAAAEPVKKGDVE